VNSHGSSTKARLLVAAPELVDPNFCRTVVLMLEHDENGALGLVLNRPRMVGGGEAVPHWADRLAAPGHLHDGGPVSKDSVIGLGLGGTDGEGTTPLLGRLCVVDLHRSPDELADVEQVRLFAGYSGWTGGQLDAELVAGGWIVVDAQEEDALAVDADCLWSAVLARQEGMTSLLADYPDDPAVN